MKRIMKENVANVNVGNDLLRTPKREIWNSFSKPINTFDKYPRSKNKRGKLNKELEEMEI